MAADATLLAEMLAGAHAPAVRIYQWSASAVTVGRLQNEDDVRARFPGLTLVRRPTGGRAVLHGDDLTVTVATRDEYLPRGTGGAVMSSYQVIVSGVIDALKRNGIESHVGSRPLRVHGFRRDADRVDCFASVASCDIADTVTGHKLVGSAQRREQGAILQQMSIHGDVIRRLPSMQAFIDDLRGCMKAALEVDDWLTVDR
jgi:lipoate-protein ligase A